MSRLYLLVILVASSAVADSARDYMTISFPSGDGLMITADVYAPYEEKSTPFIVLFHQAGWSRGEYREIAPRLNGLGFNCMAIDQRSGNTVNGVDNETAKMARAAGRGTGYFDAMKDIEAALTYARGHYATGSVIAWGSSYSSSLVLRIAGDHPKMMDAVVSFSPGEYFSGEGKPVSWIKEAAEKIRIPVFITSAGNEMDKWTAIYEAVPSGEKTSYLPETNGQHGSRALWRQFEDSNGYWKAVESFLRQFLEK